MSQISQSNKNLFDTRPLAERLRPENIDQMVGHAHLLGQRGAVRSMLNRNFFPNLILFGPPGTGKTTLAKILAKKSARQLFMLNATTASIADIKDVIEKSAQIFGTNGTILYLDEIQYFNRKQQQTLLENIENGKVTLIASTTENPYMYVYNAIISRSTTLEFKSIEPQDMIFTLHRGVDLLRQDLQLDNIEICDTLLLEIAKRGAGDVRRAVGLLESFFYTFDWQSGDTPTIEFLDSFTPKIVGNFDATGNVHYDLLSALQKSIRGSDPDASVFYLAKILTGGDLIGACRRLRVIASEDIALAYPMAVTIVHSCVEDAMKLGMPEAALPLSYAAILLATSPKSNSAKLAYFKACELVERGAGQNLPDALRPINGYKGYIYPHDFKNHYIEQQYLPDDIKDERLYNFGDNKVEQAAQEYWNKVKGKNI